MSQTTQARLDPEKLLALTTTKAVQFTTKLEIPASVGDPMVLWGNGSTPEESQRTFLVVCEGRLSELEERGHRGQLYLDDAERLLWLRSKLRTAKEDAS